MRLNSIIYENFYPDPFAVRNKVLKQKFYPADYLGDTVKVEGMDSDDVFEISKIGNFCGERTIRATNILPEEDKHTINFVNQVCKFNDNTKLHVETYFTLQTAGHDLIDKNIHQDTDPIMAIVVYLTPSPEVDSGTIFYSHKKTNWNGVNKDRMPDRAFEDMYPENRNDQNKDNFHVESVVGNVFNRIVLYDSKLLHAPGTCFGKNKEDCRLTQTSFIFRLA
jgi:hypothetical protein